MKKKVKYACVSCGLDADALIGTRRADAKLCRTCFGKRKDNRKNELNNLTGKEWASLSKSVEEYTGNRTQKQKDHGACFPLSLAEQQIKIYTKKGQLVFDPFMGVGTTAEAAEKLGRKSVGIELNIEFVKLAKRDIRNKKHQKIFCADVRDMLKYLKPNSVDFQLTSPPYATLLKTVKGNFAYKWQEHSKLTPIGNPPPYSNKKRDLGNLSYSDFIDEIGQVLRNTYKVLKAGAYAAWVVKDYRDLKNNKPYVNFHTAIIESAESSGFVLWDIKIYDQTRFRPLVVLGYPSKNYYLNIGHSYILIFRKPLSETHATTTHS